MDKDVRHVQLTEAQVKKALLSLFKEDIKTLYEVESYAFVSTGKVIVKLAKKS